MLKIQSNKKTKPGFFFLENNKKEGNIDGKSKKDKKMYKNE
jgi:hypothetical protein